jgi:long-subunit fatty acid transport protein
MGFDWEFLKGIHWTAGVNYDCMNMKKDQISETMTKNDLWNVGTGLKVRTAENLNLMVSYMHNFYHDVENSNQTKSMNNNGTPTNPNDDYPVYHKTKYEKYANAIAFSIEYKFL